MRNILKEKTLPLGSVVTIDKKKEPIMIIGYLGVTKDNHYSDYVGVNVYHGYVNRNYMFSQDNITNVLFMGYKDKRTDDFLNNLTEVKKELKEGKTIGEVISHQVKIVEDDGGDK